MSIRIQDKGNIYSNIFSRAYSRSECAQKGFTKEEYSTRKAEYAQRLQDKNSGSVVDQAISYADQLKTSRAKSKSSSLEKKKLQYSFKKISSQIVRSKNSLSARKAVQAAKREIQRLKHLKGSGEYDDEEIQLAIDHAKAIEKVAEKKVHHLEQEEMIERTGKGAGAALKEIKKNQDEKPDENEEEALLDNTGDESEDFEDLEVDDGSNIQQEVEAAQYEYQLQMQELSSSNDQIVESADESTSEMIDELSDEMSELMDEMGLDELADTLYAPDPNMSEDDLKILKIKHRGKELKEIAEADKEYLKGVMEHEKEKAEGHASDVGAASSAPKIFSNKNTDIKPVISMPGCITSGIEAPTISGSFNVSI